MSHRPGTDESRSNQTISQEPHSEQHWEDRGTADAVHDDVQQETVATRSTQSGTNMERRARERADHDESGGKQAAKVAGTATGMFFPVVIIAIVAIVVILFFVL